MATGLLGSATITSSSSGNTTVYTVPSSGVSYAVVHITISMEGTDDTDGDDAYVTVEDNPVVSLNPMGGFNHHSLHKHGSNSVSMMLSPGNVVKLYIYRSTVGCTVSGYEVA